LDKFHKFVEGAGYNEATERVGVIAELLTRPCDAYGKPKGGGFKLCSKCNISCGLCV